MKPPANNVDKYGFPIPPTFEDLPSAAAKKSRKASLSKKTFGWILGLAILLMLCWEAGVRDVVLMWPVEWNVNHAKESLVEGQLDRALRGYDNAIAWTEWPALGFLWKAEIRRKTRTELHLERGRVRVEAEQLQEALEDFGVAIELTPGDWQSYVQRGTTYQRLEMHRRAIDDLNTAVRINAGIKSGPRSDAMLLNTRAYVRAIAGMELEEALEDVEKALALAGRGVPEYLDTRAFVRFQLGQLDDALTDMEEAIKPIEQKYDWLRDPEMKRRWARQFDPRLRDYEQRLCEQTLAVMYHHRGQIHEKLGNADKAQDDLRRGDELGYNPAKGVY